MNPKPATPVVVATGDTLTSSATTGNQWFYSDTQTGTGNFNIYPVPNDGRFTVSMTSAVQENFTLTIYNNLGAQIREVKNIEVNGQFSMVVDFRPAAAGIYTVVIRNKNSRVVKKVVINK